MSHAPNPARRHNVMSSGNSYSQHPAYYMQPVAKRWSLSGCCLLLFQALLHSTTSAQLLLHARKGREPFKVNRPTQIPSWQWGPLLTSNQSLGCCCSCCCWTAEGELTVLKSCTIRASLNCRSLQLLSATARSTSPNRRLQPNVARQAAAAATAPASVTCCCLNA